MSEVVAAEALGLLASPKKAEEPPAAGDTAGQRASEETRPAAAEQRAGTAATERDVLQTTATAAAAHAELAPQAPRAAADAEAEAAAEVAAAARRAAGAQAAAAKAARTAARRAQAAAAAFETAKRNVEKVRACTQGATSTPYAYPLPQFRGQLVRCLCIPFLHKCRSGLEGEESWPKLAKELPACYRGTHCDILFVSNGDGETRCRSCRLGGTLSRGEGSDTLVDGCCTGAKPGCGRGGQGNGAQQVHASGACQGAFKMYGHLHPSSPFSQQTWMEHIPPSLTLGHCLACMGMKSLTDLFQAMPCNSAEMTAAIESVRSGRRPSRATAQPSRKKAKAEHA